MWKLKKLGFHLYTMAQIIMLIMLALLGRAHIGPGDIMLTVLFVVFYALAFFKKNDSIQK
jgi:Ca2+/Na+ antiporter